MVIRFARSAFRHGVSETRVLYVIESCPLPLYLESTTSRAHRVLFLWHDLNGVPLEVIALETGNGNLLVIHAMRMRRSYESRLLEVLGSLKR